MKLLFLIMMVFCCAKIQGAVWEMTDFIWNGEIAACCDKGAVRDPHNFLSSIYSIKEYGHIKSGNTVWIRSNYVKKFFEKTFPKIQEPFVLVISGEDNSFPSESGLNSNCLNLLLASKKVIHIFAQNCDKEAGQYKISHLPIGVDFHTIAYRAPGHWGETGSPSQQEACLKQILQTLEPTYLRKKQAFVDFQHFDSIRYGSNRRYLKLGEDRTTIFNRLLPTGLIEFGEKMKRSSLWKIKGQYAFSISPHGNGLDCHRTWEDLILGCIVIVKTSPLDPLYVGLPVVIVQDWSEVTAENMDRWLEEYGDAFTNPSYREKLTNTYWINKIKAEALPYRK
ncbi:MAG: hypothetical protein WCF65_02585 [Parachlamydiaceae bacterium]